MITCVCVWHIYSYFTPHPHFLNLYVVLAPCFLCLVFLSMFLDPDEEEFKDKDGTILSTIYTEGDVDARIAE